MFQSNKLQRSREPWKQSPVSNFTLKQGNACDGISITYNKHYPLKNIYCILFYSNVKTTLNLNVWTEVQGKSPDDRYFLENKSYLSTILLNVTPTTNFKHYKWAN